LNTALFLGRDALFVDVHGINVGVYLQVDGGVVDLLRVERRLLWVYTHLVVLRFLLEEVVVFGLLSSLMI